MSLEENVIKLIATDKLFIPIKSMAGKLERARPKLAKLVTGSESFDGDFVGERVYAKVSSEDKMKARGMRKGIDLFSKKFPEYGKILNEIIDEERTKRETYLNFGMNEGCIMNAGDYREVMTNLHFTLAESEQLYPRLMEISRKLSRARDYEERSIIIG